MKAALLCLTLSLIVAGVRGGESTGPATEPNTDEFSGTWEPGKAALERLQDKVASPRLRELVLRRNGTFLLQGISAQWTATAPGPLPAGGGEAGGKWQWVRNGDRWELRLQIANLSLVVRLRGEPSAWEIVIPSSDTKGNFETVVHRASLNE
jgi:hypothetical protein